MALATRCPHCQTAFRVASDQLKLRAGLVRCGTCKQIFNGIENLLRPDEDIPAALAGAGRPLPPVPVLDTQDKALPPPRGDNTRFNDLIAEVDYPDQLQDAGPLPTKGYAANYAPVPLPAVASDAYSSSTSSTSDALWAALDDDPAPHEAYDDVSSTTFDTQAVSAPDTPTTSTPLSEQGSDSWLPETANSGTGLLPSPEDDTVPERTADPQPDGVPKNPQPLPGLLRAARIDADEDVTLPIRAPLPRVAPAVPEPPAEVPDFIAREQQEQGTQRVLRPALWSIGALLALLLAGQLAYAMRSPIAATFPQSRGTLDAACRMLGCLVGLPMQIESVSIESSDFQPVPNRRDQFVLGVVLRNRSSTVEAWPAIELSLNDASDKTVGRRVILPREFLPPGLTTARGFAAGSEQSLKVYFDLARLPASGYKVYLFYP